MDSQPVSESLCRSTRETRPPVHLKDYEVKYSGVKEAARHTDPDTHTRVGRCWNR